MSHSVKVEQDAAMFSLVEVVAAFPFWPLSVACMAIDAAHREQGRHLPQPGALPLQIDEAE